MGSLQPENESKQELNDSGCVQDASVTDGYKGQAQLLDLSDDVLLCILRYCSPRDLKALGYTCPRLGSLICDRTLWLRVDDRETLTGAQRLRWYLTNCLSTNTNELQLTGFVNKEIRCLGVQDLTNAGGRGIIPSVYRSGGVVDQYMLRMWYPNLPRFAQPPRWPDKQERAGKAYIPRSQGNINQPLSPLSRLASDIVEEVTGPSHSRNSSGPSDGPKAVHEEMAKLCPGPRFTLDQTLLKVLRVRCDKLTSLSLEYCYLDYKSTNIRYFPTTLKKLSLKGSRCFNLPTNTSYLGKIQDRLPLLEYLDVSECDWFEPASLMALSKLPNLRYLYMKVCIRLTECVAYASLATRYGFQKLKVLDMRGSPVADSEVSAFGWLPVLEELYISPAQENKTLPEHDHKWEDVVITYDELEPWEFEEPDYYRSKSPPPEFVEEEEEEKEEDESRITDPYTARNYTNCERRIIVIQPTRPPPLPPPVPPPVNNEPQADNQQVPPPAAPAMAGVFHMYPIPPNRPYGPQYAPYDPRAVLPPDHDQPSPGPSKRPHPDQVLDLVKRPKLDKQTNTVETAPNDVEDKAVSPKSNYESSSESSDSDSDDYKPKNANVDDSYVEPRIIDLKHRTNDIIMAIRSRNAEAARASSDRSRSPVYERSGPSREPDAVIPPNRNLDASPEAGPSTSRPVDASRGRPSPAPRQMNFPTGEPVIIPRPVTPSFMIDNVPDPEELEPERPERPHTPELEMRQQPGHRDNVYHFDVARNDAMMLERMMMDRVIQFNQGIAQEREGLPYMELNINLHRRNCQVNMPPNTLPRNYGPHLVSDSAILRFGRSENDNINYVHIGQDLHGNDPGVRPERSNLRVLSMAGYSHITNRSLEHLATAAPHIRWIDVSNTSVTPRGVEVFRAIRPNCEVIYTECRKDI